MRALRQFIASREMGLLALVAIVLIGEVVMGESLNTYNLQTIALNNTVLLLLALGVAPVIIAGDIDISIVAMLALTGVVMAQLWTGGLNIWLAASVAVILGAFLGLINGILVVLLDLPSLAVTLGTMGAFTGVAFLILQGRAIINFPSGLLFVGSGIIQSIHVPVATVVVLLLFAILGFIVHGTSYGKSLFAVGGGRQAALYSGVAVVRTRLIAFVLAGTLSAIAAVFYLGNYDTAQATIASDELLPAITVVILGGVSAYGGIGTIPGVGLAAILLVFLENILGFLGISGQGQTIAVGVLLIVAVGGGKLAELFKPVRRTTRQPKGVPIERSDDSRFEPYLAKQDRAPTFRSPKSVAVSQEQSVISANLSEEGNLI